MYVCMWAQLHSQCIGYVSGKVLQWIAIKRSPGVGRKNKKCLRYPPFKRSPHSGVGRQPGVDGMGMDDWMVQRLFHSSCLNKELSKQATNKTWKITKRNKQIPTQECNFLSSISRMTFLCKIWQHLYHTVKLLNCAQQKSSFYEFIFSRTPQSTFCWPWQWRDVDLLNMLIWQCIILESASGLAY